MYTDEDLYQAVKKGIFEESAVDDFRRFISRQANTQSVDEENFKLLTGFNDVFVSISAFLMMISASWIFSQLNPSLGFLLIALIAWFLSRVFILEKRLALPAILLLGAFVCGAAGCVMSLLISLDIKEEIALLISFAIGALAAWIHWRKFHVPVTVAAGTLSLIASIVTLLAQGRAMEPYYPGYIFISGVITFILAMYWDSRDTQRKTHCSDVAFWLHLVSAPLIVHPVFTSLGIFDGEASLVAIITVIFLYIILGTISIAVDRRALMVSSLVYVLFAFSELVNTYGAIKSGLPVSGVFIGSVLLLVSAYWQQSRRYLFRYIPDKFARYLPKTG